MKTSNMTNENLAEHLANEVRRILSCGNAGRFRQYWELYKQVAEITAMQGLFIRSDDGAGYFNVAIIGEGRIADIEGDESGGTGAMHVYPLSSVRELALHRGPLPSLPHSQGASLVLLLSLTGQDSSGPYWVAKTPDDEERLLSFSRSLVQLVSAQ